MWRIQLNVDPAECRSRATLELGGINLGAHCPSNLMIFKGAGPEEE